MRVKALNAYTLEILGEKHTILNLLRWSILEFEKEQEIELVGYTIPHPMEDKAIMKIQLQKEKQTQKEILDVLRRGIISARRVITALQENRTISAN